MSFRITAALGAAALALGVGIVVAPAASAGGCGTWQYKVTEDAVVYANDGTRVLTVSRGHYLNVGDGDGNGSPDGAYGRYYGTVYTPSKARLTSGGILKSKLDYVTCW